MIDKNYLEWLKKNDPITYYEMTSDPTNGKSDSYFILTLIIIFLTLLFLILI